MHDTHMGVFSFQHTNIVYVTKNPADRTAGFSLMRIIVSRTYSAGFTRRPFQAGAYRQRRVAQVAPRQPKHAPGHFSAYRGASVF
jgi:hypothetical protein